MKSLIRSLRLASGLVLLAFVVMHLANLALGLVSLATMEAWRAQLVGPWQSGIGKFLVPGAALVHVALGLYAIASRNTLAMSRTDIVQLVLGLLTPPLLLNHILVMSVAVRLAPEFEPSYSQILTVYWSLGPANALLQLLAVIAVWVHGAIGLHAWLVVKPLWRRVGPVVLPLLFAVPILALLGFAEAGKEVLARLASDAAADVEWRETVIATIRLLDPLRPRLAQIQAGILEVYGTLVFAAFLVHALRRLANRGRPVRVDYDGGLAASGLRGQSILELSRLNGVPHADVCSGRARCGTCRVRVTRGADALSARNDVELAVLHRVGAAADVRLACQARVLATGVSVTRLLPPHADAEAARAPDAAEASMADEAVERA